MVVHTATSGLQISNMAAHWIYLPYTVPTTLHS